jgi:hypothetical protein
VNEIAAPGGGTSVAPGSNGTAAAALTFGLGSALCLCACLPLSPLLGVTAVALAHAARGTIKRSDGARSGLGIASAAEVLGWIGIITSVFIVVVVILFFVLVANSGSGSPVYHRSTCFGC